MACRTPARTAIRCSSPLMGNRIPRFRERCDEGEPNTATEQKRKSHDDSVVSQSKSNHRILGEKFYGFTLTWKSRRYSFSRVCFVTRLCSHYKEPLTNNIFITTNIVMKQETAAFPLLNLFQLNISRYANSRFLIIFN